MRKFILIILLFSIGACKKHIALQQEDVKIKNLSLDEIRAYINGTWQLHYSVGGITGIRRIDYTNTYVTFSSQDHMTFEGFGRVLDAPITWKYTNDIFLENTYIIQYPVGFNGPIGIDGIYKDTLLIYDDFYDAYKHYLTRK